MVFEEEATSVSPVDTEELTLQNKSPLSCPPCPPVSLSPSRVATPAGYPLPSLTQAQAFSLNKNNTLCLPVFSPDNKLVWVHSDAIAQEVAHAADALHAAFGVFPYPRRDEMAKLARRCSLHVDRVRVWFMFQRLQYGISWDYADVSEVRRRLLGPGRRKTAKVAAAAVLVVVGEDEPQVVREQGEEEEEEEEEAAAREDVLEEAGERGSSEGSGSCVKMGARGVAAEKGEEGRGGGSGETGVSLDVGDEAEEEEEGEQGQEGRVETPGRPRKRKLGEEKEKGKTAMKRTREGTVDKTSARDKGTGHGQGDRARSRKGAEQEDPLRRSEDRASADGGRAQVTRSTSPAPGRLKQDGEPGRVEGGMALLTNREPVPESTATPPPVSSVRRPYRRYRKKTKKKNTPFDLLPKVQVSESPLASKGHTGQSGTGENHAGRKTDSTATAGREDDGVDGVAPGDGATHGCTPALGDKARPPVVKPRNKTKEQLNQLHRAFLACQYPNPKDYDQLSEWTGLQRRLLIQWFGDTRYDMKNSKPHWITPKDQQRIMARLRQRQRLKHLKTVEAAAGPDVANDAGAGIWRLKLEEQ